MNYLETIIPIEEINKINPKIINHSSLTSPNPELQNILNNLFSNSANSRDLVFRLQLLDLLILHKTEHETIKDRQPKLIKNLPKLLNETILNNYERHNGYTEYYNLINIATNKTVRQQLAGLKVKDLKQIGLLELDEIEEIPEIISYYLSEKTNRAKLLPVIQTIDQFLVDFSRKYINSKIYKKTENNEETIKPLEEELTFIEDILLLLDSSEKMYSSDSLIISRFLNSSKNKNAFISNLGFQESTDTTIWGLRYACSHLNFKILIETLQIMRDNYPNISINHLIKFTKLYNKDKVLPFVGIFLTE